MPAEWPPLVGIYLAINLTAFAIMGFDKLCAIRRWRRVPEKRLMSLAALFGAAGVLTAMYAFRHKTLKPLFKVGVPLILSVQIVLLLIIGFSIYSTS